MPEGNGTVVTFYSFKGGTGRTMALANVAWILASNGKRVLVADWDLESPGLHRFYHPFLRAEVRDVPGIIDLVRRYEWASVPADDTERERLAAELAKVQQYAFSLDWDFPGGGSLDFLSAGRQNSDHGPSLGALDWDNFYERLGGAVFFDALRADMKRHYDYVLIDSRTGLSDVADICTLHLPDVLVDCFTLSTQGIEGAAHIAQVVGGQYASRGIRILPVPMRVDQAEKQRVDMGLAYAMRRLAGVPEMAPADRRLYWREVEVPYLAYYAYEEMLAVFGDGPGAPNSLLASFERLTKYITDDAVTSLPEIPEQIRQRVREEFTRRPPVERPRIILDYGQDDQTWAEWTRAVLSAAGVDVRDRQGDASAARAMNGEEPARLLSIVSGPTGRTAGDQPWYAVYVGDIRPTSVLGPNESIAVAGLPEEQAITQLIRMVGGTDYRTTAPDRRIGVRYPGTDPLIARFPARNVKFTGRQEDLRRLRRELTERGTAVVLPVTLHGLGGVGKTQVALEYVHRFKNDYDLVWWIDCGQPQFIDAALGDLGNQLQEKTGRRIVPGGANINELARAVLRELRQPEQTKDQLQRWLLVYDNAEDVDDVKPFLPTGTGHVLITSRNRAWGADDLAKPLQIDVFTRTESVAHLRQRVDISEADANQVAHLLGDLPLAVATAGAWLAETGMPVADYLSELERQGPRALSHSQLADYPKSVAQAWDLSLNRLATQSPGAIRLLELCSFLAPDISLDLLYNPTMAQVLAPLDPTLSEPMVIGRVVQEINRLALIKLDPNAKQIRMHRLVQAVVKDRLSKEEAERTRQEIHQLLAAARPRRDVDDPDTWSRYRMIWPHLNPSGARSSQREQVRSLLIDRVRYLWLRGDLERGRRIAEDVEKEWRELIEARSDDPDFAALPRQLLHLRFNHANILRDLARFQEAKQMDEAVAEAQRELLGPDHPHTLMTGSGLTADLRALGDYSRSREMDSEILPAWTSLYGEDHYRTLNAGYNLAVSYRVTGDFRLALDLDEQVLERRRATLGPLHPRTFDSSLAVARDLLEAGRYHDAVGWMKSVQQTCAEALGADSRTTFIAHLLLGMALRSAGHPRDAEPHFVDALEGLGGRFGEDSTEALACRLSRSTNLIARDERGDVFTAAAEIQEVKAVYERRLGSDHPHTLVSQVNLTTALRLQGDPSAHRKARTTIEAAATGLGARVGTKHPYTLAAQTVFAVILGDAGDLEQAHSVEDETARLLAEVLGEAHPDALRCRANLMITRKALGDPEAAVGLTDTIDVLADQIGSTHPNISTLREGRKLLRALDPQQL